MASPLHFKRNDCRICGSRSLTKVMSLGSTPPANAFLKKEQISGPEPKFPLDLYLCGECGHLQLLDVVSPELLFGNYVYVSSTSPSFVEHFRHYSADVASAYELKPGQLAVEIGSNDGILLRHFKGLGMNVLGVDPAREIAGEATRSGIETLPEFFSPRLAEKIRRERGAASVVAANNVFAHADDLHGILEGVRILLAPGGIFVFEVSYLADVVEKTLFDTIYHEHLSYHSVRPLEVLFAAHGMELIDVIRVPTHGGSLRGIVQVVGGPHARKPSVAALLEMERKMGLDRPETFERFARNIQALKQQLNSLLRRLRSEGKRIAGFGAPAKLTTLMHHFEIGPDLVEFVVDDSPLKQGLYTPGYHIPVVSAAHLQDHKPDYLLVLAWNFADNIIKNQQAFAAGGGRFIVPLPSLRTV